MGCGELSKIKKSQSLPILMKSRISKEFKRGETISTERNSRHSSRIDSIRTIENKERGCLKFKIFEEFYDIVPQIEGSSENILQYSQDITYVKKQ